MRGKKFQMRVIVLMYRIQYFGWTTIFQFAVDLCDIAMWLIQ